MAIANERSFLSSTTALSPPLESVDVLGRVLSILGHQCAGVASVCSLWSTVASTVIEKLGPVKFVDVVDAILEANPGVGLERNALVRRAVLNSDGSVQSWNLCKRSSS